MIILKESVKTFLSFFLLSLCIEVAASQTTSAGAEEKIRKVEWLLGTWNRINATLGRSGVEVWERISGGELHGKGVTTKGNDATFIEKLKIVAKEIGLYYIAEVPENKGVVFFKLTQLSENGFICEKPDHDFPKKIQYELKGKKLKVTVSGNWKSTEYLFE